MISTAWLTAGALLVGLLCVILATATVLQRAAQDFVQRRDARVLAPIRPLVLRLSAGADDGSALRQLTGLNRRSWRTIEPLVVTMLGKIRGEARDDLVTLLQVRGAGDQALLNLQHRSMTKRARAAEALGVLGVAEYVEPLLGRLVDPSPDVRQVAARALGSIGEPAAAPALLDVLDSDRTVPAQTVAQALLRIGVAATPTLVSALGSERETVRAVAVEVLGLLQAVTAVKAMAVTLARDPSPAVRERAATALGRLGHPAALSSLAAAAAPDQSPALRAAAASAMGDLGARAAVPELARLLTDPYDEVARNAATALSRLGAAGLAALTAATLTDPPPDGALVVIAPAAPAPGAKANAQLRGLAGAHAAAALAALPAERGRLRG
jgi:HEAT repeat protein